MMSYLSAKLANLTVDRRHFAAAFLGIYHTHHRGEPPWSRSKPGIFWDLQGQGAVVGKPAPDRR